MDIEVKMPDIGLDEVEVVEILVKINETVELEQGLITVEGDKTSMEIPSPVSGIIKKLCVDIGDKIKTSTLIMICESHTKNSFFKQKKMNFLEQNANNQEVEKKIFYSKNTNFERKKNNVHATPFIRRLARTLDIDLHNISGTGRKNRILQEDIDQYQKKYLINNSKEIDSVDYINANQLQIKEINLSNLQRVTGNNLYKNWINIPHVTQFDEVNITALEAFRKKYNNENKINNNITILVFILKIVASALEKFPIFNSSLTSDQKKIILKKYINIGVAVDVSEGLLVPVLKNVNQKNIQDLSSELILLSEKARKRQLSLSDTSDGCFTISNLGGIGGSWFSPIINAPEVAILGVSRSQIKPLWNGKEFIPSCMLPLSLSYDHRVINGADGARFITFISKLLSDIRLLIM